ncbi:hypothetical protein [Limnobaculum xujianqingii]|uniref:hypothetical protein n=1 Tax=Limnobaculum xujianqingii TaxID=2738837 RepID=UPI00112D2EA6|nr:hypothetical protein [Limnobaculum xujianqingii]
MKEKEIMAIIIRVIPGKDGIHHQIDAAGHEALKDIVKLYLDTLEKVIPATGAVAQKMLIEIAKSKGCH